MTKDVLVTIVGNQEQDNEISLMTQGTYYLKDGKHYVFYEEQADAQSEIVKNRLCFDKTVFEMVKKGGLTSTMTFNPEQITLTTYLTPYGPIPLEIVTHHYELRAEEDVMEMDIYYALGYGDQDSTDCHVYVKLEARQTESE